MGAFRSLVLATFSGCAFSTALAAQEANIKMGREIALEYCVECHSVEPSGEFKMQPPSFAAIAKFRSREQIEHRIVEPLHVSMPRYNEYMIGGNIDDMVAYIVSLEN